MIRGIGIDMVEISRLEKMLTERSEAAFLRKAFTPEELALAPERIPARAEYLAGRLAVKEAVFKAIAHLTQAGAFDMRIVETLRGKNGCPVITTTGAIAVILKETGVNTLHVSITNEAGIAAAFVIAEQI